MKEQAHTHAPIRMLVAVLVVILGAVAIWLYFSTQSTAPSASKSSALSGLLIMSAGVTIDGSTDFRVLPAIYDFGSGQTSLVPAQELAGSPTDRNVAYQYSFSSSGNFATFLGSIGVPDSVLPFDAPLQVYRADLSGAVSYDDFLQKLKDAPKLTSVATNTLVQSPSISNDGGVLFMAHPHEPAQALAVSNAESWEIGYVSPSGDEQVLTHGIQPKWVTNDKFIYIKNDGLYLYTVSSRDETRIWGMQGSATASMYLDVSDDGQYVAWAAPAYGAVYLLRALSWSDGTLTLKHTLPEPATTAIFSPDSNTIALTQMASSTASLSAGAPNGPMTLVSFYDVDSLAQVHSPLTFFSPDPRLTLVTDWRP